jgi:hypothetical protein
VQCRGKKLNWNLKFIRVQDFDWRADEHQGTKAGNFPETRKPCKNRDQK